jgi:hypothetical protein
VIKYKILKTRDFSNRLTLEIADIDYSSYKILTKKLMEKFRLVAQGDFIDGVTESFQTFTKDKYSISIEYDIWSGFTVVAKDKESENLVDRIYEWFMR